jgi:threonylcarbamoyladenosine tRNA methylthiotransferase MtaB
MLSFSIQNFGCRVNQAEAFAWIEAVEKGGLRYEDDWGRSDLVLINSCTLTSRADRDARKFINRVSRENPGARLVVTGCWAEGAREEIAKIPQVLLVLRNNEKDRLPEKVLSLVARPAPEAGEEPPAGGEAQACFRARAPLKIQDGCDNRCTFCIIPSVRGRSVSLGPDEVLARVRDLVGRGYREIVLSGIHLSSYGRDREPRGSLLELLRNVEDVEGLGRLRLSSLDPRRTDAALLKHIAGNPKVCQHFHFSLQHSSERVLREMGRSVRPAIYRSILSDLRKRSPEASLGADVIVGFPGETGEDFAGLEDFLEDSPLTYFHVFSYSPRAGTPAAARPQVPERVKRERSLVLRRLSGEKNLRFRETFAGKTLDAVVIRKGRGRGDLAAGAADGAEVLTGNYFMVSVPSCPVPKREIVRVRVGRALPRSMEGSVEVS